MEEDNLETYILVWLDATVDSSEQKLTIQRKLRSSINYLRSFNNEYQCENYLSSTSENDRIVLIISGQLGKDLVHHIHHLRQICSIYIYCIDRRKHQSWANQYRKIKCLITDENELVAQIEHDQNRRNHTKIDEPLSISIFDEHVINSIEESNCSIDNNLIYSQLLINSLLQMKTFVNDKKQLIHLCKNYFRQNEELLLTIDEFEKKYSSLKSIWWLTRNSFISRLIDKALQTKNYNILFLSRFFLQDISKQIQQNKLIKPIRVYKTQLLTEKEFQFLECSIGNLISINSFFLTNLNKKQSLTFLKESTIADSLHRILFEIDANPKLNGIKSFANITSLSYSTGEQRILFMPGSIFRINNIRQDEKKLSTIQMVLATNHEQEFETDHNLEQYDLLSFGQMLIDMKKFNQAEIYFNHFLHDLPFQHSDIPLCYDALGNILLEKGQYSASLKWFNKSLEIKIDTLDQNDPMIASLYNNIASVYLKKDDSKRALESYNMALNIFQEKFGQNNPHITECLNNMAMIYRNDYQYEQALELYQRTLEIHQKYLSDDHAELAMSHNNMAIVYAHLKQYDLALEHFNKALTIYEKILPIQHALISMIFENIGNIHYDKKEYQQGLVFYEKAATMYRSLLPSTHSDVLQIDMTIRRIQSKIKYM